MVKEKIQSLIAKDDLESAINELLLISETKSKQFRESSLMLSNRFVQYEKNKNQRTEKNEELLVEKNKIVKAVLELIDEPEIKKQKRWRIFLLFSMLGIALCIFCIEYFFEENSISKDVEKIDNRDSVADKSLVNSFDPNIQKEEKTENPIRENMDKDDDFSDQKEIEINNTQLPIKKFNFAIDCPAIGSVFINEQEVVNFIDDFPDYKVFLIDSGENKITLYNTEGEHILKGKNIYVGKDGLTLQGDLSNFLLVDNKHFY